MLQYSFSWHQLSAIAGVTFWQFYFRFFPGSIRAPQLVAFLRALRVAFQYAAFDIHYLLLRYPVYCPSAPPQLEPCPAVQP